MNSTDLLDVYGEGDRMSKRGWLVWIWLVSYVVCFVGLLILWPLGDAHPANLKGAIGSMTALYTPYLLPIATFWFLKRSSPRTNPSGEAFWIAVVISVLFNMVTILVICSIHFQTAKMTVLSDTIELVSTLCGYLSFLTGPSIGYFFGKAA